MQRHGGLLAVLIVLSGTFVDAGPAAAAGPTCPEIGHMVFPGDAEWHPDRDPDGDLVGCESFPDTSRPSGYTSITGTGAGYWMTDELGRVYDFGDADHQGEPLTMLGCDASSPTARAVKVVADPTDSTGGSYWVLDTSGKVHSYGTLLFGDLCDQTLLPGEVPSTMAPAPDAGGYWIFTNLGRAFAFGGVGHFDDMAGVVLNGPVVDSVATPSGLGYYMVGSDGGVFAFGDAQFHGSMGGLTLNRPVNGLVPDPDGTGYWLVASDGGVFAYEADFAGSMGAATLNRPVVGMVAYGNGYLMVGSDGGIFAFSDREFVGSLGDQTIPRAITSAAALPTA
ncbi:MAG: hypothetical protein GY698_09945 [Actinomycetia bacterium]|nr:hypothetical protein [Actinomycetes bacterium]